MPTLLDRLIAFIVLGGFVVFLLARTAVAWTTFRMQRRMTLLTRQGLDALQQLAEKIGNER